jgi:hypothetical protein
MCLLLLLLLLLLLRSVTLAAGRSLWAWATLVLSPRQASATCRLASA